MNQESRARKVVRGMLLVFAAAVPLVPKSLLAQAGPYSYFAVTPCRAYDTRNGSTLTLGVIAAGEVRTFTLKGTCGIPTDAKAASLNLTVVSPTGAGDLRIAPTGTAFPNVSTSNYRYQENLANGAIVPLNAAVNPPTADIQVLGAMCCAAPPLVYHLVIDVTGYFK